MAGNHCFSLIYFTSLQEHFHEDIDELLPVQPGGGGYRHPAHGWVTVQAAADAIWVEFTWKDIPTKSGNF